MSTFSLEAWAAPRRAAVEAALAAPLASYTPPLLKEASLYPLQTGGKRIRPLLCFAACEALGGAWERALPAAVAVELVHTFSRVHDDLPCMDDDDERRGMPTVHRRYTEAIALLVGDALLNEAHAVLAGMDAPADTRTALVRDLADGTRGMIVGQTLDITATGGEDLDALVTLHRAKTGALIRAAIRMGGRIALATAGASGEGAGEALAALDTYGDAVGLAFQIHDDVLDADQDAGEGGPPSFVRILGVDGTRAAALEQAERALAAAKHLPNPGALLALARFTVERAH